LEPIAVTDETNNSHLMVMVMTKPWPHEHGVTRHRESLNDSRFVRAKHRKEDSSADLTEAKSASATTTLSTRASSNMSKTLWERRDDQASMYPKQ
jgi:hypothetical protein